MQRGSIQYPFRAIALHLPPGTYNFIADIKGDNTTGGCLATFIGGNDNIRDIGVNEWSQAFNVDTTYQNCKIAFTLSQEGNLLLYSVPTCLGFADATGKEELYVSNAKLVKLS